MTKQVEVGDVYENEHGTRFYVFEVYGNSADVLGTNKVYKAFIQSHKQIFFDELEYLGKSKIMFTKLFEV